MIHKYLFRSDDGRQWEFSDDHPEHAANCAEAKRHLEKRIGQTLKRVAYDIEPSLEEVARPESILELEAMVERLEVELATRKAADSQLWEKLQKRATTAEAELKRLRDGGSPT